MFKFKYTQTYYIQDKKSRMFIIVYNHPTSLRQDESEAVATTNFA